MPVLTLHPATPQERAFSWTGSRCDIGRAAANHLQLDDVSISSYHARLELRGNDWWLVDLNSTNGTFLNGLPAKECVVREGDDIRFGERVHTKCASLVAEPVVIPPPAPVTAMPVDAPAPVPAGMAIQPVGPGTGLAPQGMVCPACRALVAFGVNFCPRCGFSLAQQAPLGFPMQPQPVGFVRPMESPGGMSVGLMPLLAFLAGLTIIGFPFAIILGLAALAQIRRHGGMESDRKQAVWGLTLGLFWALVAAGVGGYFGYRAYQRHQEVLIAEQRVEADKLIAQNESTAITLLKGIARAERLVKTVRLKDPQHTGKGQYMNLTELVEAGTSFCNRALANGRADGYLFMVLDPGEGKYLAVAEPIKYNETGRRIFTVDSSGIIRGQDAAGKTHAQLASNLPVLSDVKSAFDGVEDAIAAEAITHAKRLADEGKYELCREILDTIAAQFAMTSAAQELAAIKKTVDPFIIEAQAARKYQQAVAANTAKDFKLTIALLKEIKDLYPTYSKITQVTDELAALETALDQKLNAEAKALFEKAEALEREAKPEAALDIYVQIEKNYPGTEHAKRIAELRPALMKSIRETSAEQLFAQARELSITNDCRNIVSLIQQLQRNYADTDYVTTNRDPIQQLFQKAQAEQYRALAVEQMTAGKDADALARLEEACTHNPDLRPVFRDLYLKLYLRVGRKRTDEGDYREALRLYRSYLALEPEQNELNLAVLNRLQFALARAEFAQGNYNNAAQLLISSRKEFEKEADYNDLFASVQVAIGNYLDSLPFYDKAIAAKPTAGNYYARRGYAQLLIALQTEREAMVAYAGLLRDNTRKPPAPGKTNTNDTPAIRIVVDQPTDTNVAPSTTGSSFEPVFATVLPPTASGVKPEMQVRYDAVASQGLLEQILDLLDNITASNTSSRVRTSLQQNPAGGQRGGGRDPNDPNSGGSGTVTPISKTRERLQKIRSTVEFNNALSSLRQRILDSKSRSAKSVEAMRRMAQFFAAGNRDLAKALELGADRGPELMEILKLTQQHEKKITQAVPLIVSYLATEIDVMERCSTMTETVFQNLRMVHTGTPMDPTATLDVYFSRYFDRRDFDQGIQILREAGALKVPLEGYSLIPNAPIPPSAPSTPAPAKPPAKSPPPPAEPSPTE